MRRCAAGTAFPHAHAAGAASDAPVYTSGSAAPLALAVRRCARVGRRLRRRLVLVGIELRAAVFVFVVAVVGVRGGGVGCRGRLLVLAARAVAEPVATGRRVLAEERMRDE